MIYPPGAHHDRHPHLQKTRPYSILSGLANTAVRLQIGEETLMLTRSILTLALMPCIALMNIYLLTACGNPPISSHTYTVDEAINFVKEEMAGRTVGYPLPGEIMDSFDYHDTRKSAKRDREWTGHCLIALNTTSKTSVAESGIMYTEVTWFFQEGDKDIYIVCEKGVFWP